MQDMPIRSLVRNLCCLLQALPAGVQSQKGLFPQPPPSPSFGRVTEGPDGFCCRSLSWGCMQNTPCRFPCVLCACFSGQPEEESPLAPAYIRLTGSCQAVIHVQPALSTSSCPVELLSGYSLSSTWEGSKAKVVCFSPFQGGLLTIDKGAR